MHFECAFTQICWLRFLHKRKSFETLMFQSFSYIFPPTQGMWFTKAYSNENETKTLFVQISFRPDTCSKKPKEVI